MAAVQVIAAAEPCRQDDPAIRDSITIDAIPLPDDLPVANASPVGPTPLELLQDALERIPAWQDDFFANRDDVLAVFDLEHDALARAGCYRALCWTLLFPPLWLCLPRRAALKARSVHVALTRKGLLCVSEPRHGRLWGWERSQVLVPYTRMRKLTVSHGSLAAVRIDLGNEAAIVVQGLSKPNEFVKLVAVAQNAVAKHAVREIPAEWKLDATPRQSRR